MEKKHYFGLLVLVAIGILIFIIIRLNIPTENGDDQEPINCNTKTVFHYKHPDKIFPVFIRDYETNVKLTTGILNKILGEDTGNSSDMNINVKNQAQQLRDTLNQDNIFYENNLKAYFMASNEDPCNDSLRYLYIGYIKEMSLKVIQLKSFVNSISTPAGNLVKTNTHKNVIAIIDSSSKTIKKDRTNPENQDLVVLKDPNAIASAIKKLNLTYQDIDQKQIPATQNIDQKQIPATQNAATVEKIRNYQVVYDNSRYTGRHFQSEIIDSVTVFVDEINQETAEIRLSVSKETTDKMEVQLSKALVKYFDNENTKITFTLTKTGKRGLTKVAYYQIKIEKRSP